MVSRQWKLCKHFTSQLATAKTLIPIHKSVVGIYTIEVGKHAGILVNCGKFRLYIILSVPCFHKCGQFKGDLYKCCWYFYIREKFYTVVEFSSQFQE